jgi:hypothetical protein
MIRKPMMFITTPVFTISITRIVPLAKTIALGGVAENNKI